MTRSCASAFTTAHVLACYSAPSALRKEHLQQLVRQASILPSQPGWTTPVPNRLRFFFYQVFGPKWCKSCCTSPTFDAAILHKKLVLKLKGELVSWFASLILVAAPNLVAPQHLRVVPQTFMASTPFNFSPHSPNTFAPSNWPSDGMQVKRFH